MKPRAGFWKDKLLPKFIKKEREITQINRSEKRQVTTYTTEIQKMVREYYAKLYANKLDNLEEIKKFLKTYNFPKLN